MIFGGGNGCAGRGCLFWLIDSVAASVALTVLVNLALVLIRVSERVTRTGLSVLPDVVYKLLRRALY